MTKQSRRSAKQSNPSPKSKRLVLSTKPFLWAVGALWSHLIGVGAAGAAEAKTPTQTQTQTQTLSEVQVHGTADQPALPNVLHGPTGTPLSLRDLPQSATVLSRRMIDETGAINLKEALRTVPGITLSAGEGGQIGDNINLRGFSARTDMFLDGFRDRGQYVRDVFLLDQLEVLKGPSSLLFGRGSTGGVINQVSKKPSRKPISEVSLAVGTQQDTRVTVDLNRPMSETSAFRLAAFGQDMGSTREVIRNQDFGLAPSWRWGMGSPTEVTVSALVQHNHDVPDFGFPLVYSQGAGSVRKPIDAPMNRFYGFSDDFFNQTINQLSTTLIHRLSPTATWRNQFQIGSYGLDTSPSPIGSVARLGGGTPSASDPLSQLTGLRQNKDRSVTDSTLSNQTELLTQIQQGGLTHHMTLGLQLSRDTYKEDQYAWNTSTADATINLGNPSSIARPGSRALAYQLQTTAHSLATYANDQIDWNAQHKTVLGLRWERYTASTDLNKYALPTGYVSPYTPINTPKEVNIMVSPRAGWIYQPSETRSYYVSYGVSFNPSAESVTQTGATQSGTAAGLAPEKNVSYEVGSKHDYLNGHLTVNTALFQITKQNARMRDGISTTQVLDGRIRVRGAELSVTGQIQPRWQVFGGYTFLDGRIVSSSELGTGLDLNVSANGKTAPNTPRHTATLWSTYRLDPQENWGPWELGLGVLSTSARYLNNYETAQVDGYTRLDASLAYVHKQSTWRFFIQNLTNARFFEVASAGRATPAAGLAARLTMTYRF
jgi:catecholate siderophore receptor